MEMKNSKNQNTGGSNGGGMPGGSGGSGGSGGGTVNVQHAMHSFHLDVAGQKVSDVKGKFSKLLNIDPEAIAVIDGNEVSDDTVIGEGVETLHFVKRSSVKG